MSEYQKQQEATRLLTEKLRQERLAREAQDAQAAEAEQVAEQRAPRAKKRA